MYNLQYVDSFISSLCFLTAGQGPFGSDGHRRPGPCGSRLTLGGSLPSLCPGRRTHPVSVPTKIDSEETRGVYGHYTLSGDQVGKDEWEIL